MGKAISYILAALFIMLPSGEAFAAVWVNDSPDAFVKRIEIYDDNGLVQLPDNPLLPTEGYADITFQNDVEYTGLALHPTAGSISPSFLPAVNGYTLFTVYYCDQASAPVSQVCDGIALRLQGGQLCAGFFQYSTLVDSVATIADIGCFVLEEIIPPPQVSQRDFLQKLTKEQLIDIITGARPLPVGPVCLSCPPWNGYERDIARKLRDLRVRRFQVEVKELR